MQLDFAALSVSQILTHPRVWHHDRHLRSRRLLGNHAFLTRVDDATDVSISRPA